MAASRAHLAARPGLRPLVRLPRRRDPPVRPRPLPRQPLRSGRRDPSRTGYHLSDGPGRPGHRVPRRPAGRRRRPARSSSTSCTGRLPLAAPGARDVDRALPGPVRRRLGRAGGSGPSPGSWRSGVIPPGTGLSPRPPWVPAWDDLGRGSARWPPGSWSASPASSPTPTTRSAGCSTFLDDARRARRHARHPRVGQRRQRRGRARGARSTTSGCTTCDPAGPAEMHDAPRRDRRAAHATTTTRGAGRWPATRRSSAGSARCTRAAWPIPCIVRGRRGWRERRGDPPPVRPRHRRRSRRCSSWPAIEAPDDDRLRRRRRRDRRRRASPTCSAPTAPIAPRAPRDPVLRDVRLPGHLPRRVEGGDLPPGRAACTTTGSIPNAPFDDDVWELYHVADDLSETRRPGRRAPRAAGGDGRAVVGRGRAQPGAAPRQPGPLDPRPPASPTGAGARPRFRYFPGGAQVPEPVAVNVRNRSHTPSPSTSTCPRASMPTGVLLALGLGRSAAGRSTCSAAGSATCTTSTARSATSSRLRSPLAAGRHLVVMRFEKTPGLGGSGATLEVDGIEVGQGRSRGARPRASAARGWASPAQSGLGAAAMRPVAAAFIVGASRRPAIITARRTPSPSTAPTSNGSRPRWSLSRTPTMLRVSSTATSAATCVPIASTTETPVERLYGRRKPNRRTKVVR